MLILDDESLARFIIRADWLRSDGTVKHQAFQPPKCLELSVTRHSGITEDELWGIGESVAAQRNEIQTAKLIGRSDVLCHQIKSCHLSTEPDPLEGNPNHAYIAGWPKDKSAQISIAQNIARLAKTVKYSSVL